MHTNSMGRASVGASYVLLVAVLLPSIQTFNAARIAKASLSDEDRMSRLSEIFPGVLHSPEEQQQQKRDVVAPQQHRFREAPAFWNGRQCARLEAGTQSDALCNINAVHVAMTLDEAYLRGCMAATLSILKHSACPQNVVIHFLVSGRDDRQQLLESLMRSTFPELRLKLHQFEDNLVKARISPCNRSELEQALNFARIYLAHLLDPCIERVIYLDSDLVVVDDIARLWNTSLGIYAVGSPEYCQANFSKYFTAAFWSDPSLASVFQDPSRGMACYFNAGVMLMNLSKWREEDVTKKMQYWMDIQKKKQIYYLGSLPPFLLLFAGALQPIDHRWNQHGLGDTEGRNNGSSSADGSRLWCPHLHPGPVSLMHWSGSGSSHTSGKPWTRLDAGTPCPVDELWAAYDLFLPPTPTLNTTLRRPVFLVKDSD